LSLLGCVALGRFLKKNEALVELDISNNRIGLLGTQKLAAGISSHPNLKVLKVRSDLDHR
jgi:Ran GTPase-activating protein (RanGAP) involved in mRNA processing and transport